MDKRFWYAVATLVGSTVGVGIYGIPFAFQKSGFFVGFLFLTGISGLLLLTNLLYGEIVLRTHQRHQFIGYTYKYLGPVIRKINLFTFMLGIYGALIGTIIVSGGFLSNILYSWFRFSLARWSTFFVIIAAIFIFRGLRTVSRIDFSMMVIFGVIVAIIGLWGARHIDVNNFTFAVRDLWFLPFGVIMFAMNGISGVPLARETLVGREGDLKKALTVGTLIPAALYLIFTFVVTGISGDSTSPDAISGLLGFIGPKAVFIGSMLGLLTSATIFLNLGTALKESFQQDFRFKHRWAWLLAILPPYVLFLSGIRNFIDIIGLVGGVAVGIEMIVLVFLYSKARKAGDRMPEYSFRLPMPVLYLMMLLFAAGAAYTILVN